jgi:hypothetical protein
MSNPTRTSRRISSCAYLARIYPRRNTLIDVSALVQVGVDAHWDDEHDGHGATFIHTSPPGVTSTEGPGARCESRYGVSPTFVLILSSYPSVRIDTDYLDQSTPDCAYRLETYRSTGSISALTSQQLRCYFVTKCNFPSSPPIVVDGKTDIRSVSDPVFLERASEHTLELYQDVMWNVETRHGPLIKVFEVEGSREGRLVIGYKMGGTSRFFRFVFNFPVPLRGAEIMNIVPCQTCTTTTLSILLENMSVRVSCSLCHYHLLFTYILRTILERNHYYLPLPEPLAQLHRSANRAFNSSGDERGLVALSFLSLRQFSRCQQRAWRI